MSDNFQELQLGHSRGLLYRRFPFYCLVAFLLPFIAMLLLRDDEFVAYLVFVTPILLMAPVIRSFSMGNIRAALIMCSDARATLKAFSRLCLNASLVCTAISVAGIVLAAFLIDGADAVRDLDYRFIFLISMAENIMVAADWCIAARYGKVVARYSGVIWIGAICVIQSINPLIGPNATMMLLLFVSLGLLALIVVQELTVPVSKEKIMRGT